MKLLSRIILLVAVAFGLSIQPALAGSKGPVKVAKGDDVAGTTDVVIGQFTVGFLVERKDTSKARGGIFGGGSGGVATGLGTLHDYTPEQFQQVANAAYADFVAKLGAAGFTVRDRAALAALEDYAAVTPAVVGEETTVKNVVGEKAKVLFFGAEETGPVRIMMNDYPVSGFSALRGGTAGYKTNMAINEYVKSTGVRVVNVIYYMDFAEMQKRRSATTASVKFEGVLAVAENGSKLTVFTGKNTPSTITLNEPVGIEGDFFAQENGMGDGEKVVCGVGKALSVLGGMGWNGMKKREFHALEGAYPDGAVAATAEANSVLVNQLTALR